MNIGVVVELNGANAADTGGQEGSIDPPNVHGGSKE